MFDQLTDLSSSILQNLHYTEFSVETVHVFLWYMFQRLMILLLPLMLIVIVAGLAGNISQNGFMLVGASLTPKFNKLNPLTGIKRLFSLRSLVELVKSIFKLIIIGSVAYIMLRGEMDQMPGLIELEVQQILAIIGQIAMKLAFYTCLVLILLAGLDMAYQIWQHERELRMTKQEVKDEFKQREGDPAVRSRIRSVQREMAMRRMMEDVPDATVVITNPTHLAVAVKFERHMDAPRVVAKGAGYIAEKIKEIAGQHDVPIIEQKPLARALFKDVEIGQFIPVDLYHAVAEILAYVYRLKGLIHPA